MRIALSILAVLLVWAFTHSEADAGPIRNLATRITGGKTVQREKVIHRIAAPRRGC